MKPATKPLPRIRVTKLPPGTKNETASKDVMTYDLIVSVVNSLNRAAVAAMASKLASNCWKAWATGESRR